MINVFRGFLEEPIRDEYKLHGERLLGVLREHAHLRRVFGGALTALGMEPNVYLFFRAPEGVQTGAVDLVRAAFSAPAT